MTTSAFSLRVREESGDRLVVWPGTDERAERQVQRDGWNAPCGEQVPEPEDELMEQAIVSDQRCRLD